MSQENDREITFRKAILSDIDLLKRWFQKPHVKEFWDNSLEMWANVESYVKGRKVLYDYWIGYLDKDPYCLIITSDASENDPDAPGSENHLRPYLEPQGKTWTIDFMIGEESFLGRGLSYKTLVKFTDIQEGVRAFLIDPEISHTKAIHVYEKAGFEKVDTFIPKGGYFSGLKHVLMKKRVTPVHFLPFCEKDRDEFIEMGLDLWPDHSAVSLVKEFARILSSPNDEVFMAKKGEKSIGFIAMSLRFDNVPQATSKPVGYVEGIYVKEGYRKLGIAKKLYEVGEQWVKSKGCCQIGSDTWDWNQGSIAFHGKLGFVKGDTLVHFIKTI